MVTPDTVYDYDVASGTLEALKVQEIPSGYDASQYITERVSLPSRDGQTMIPASLVYKKGTPRDGSAPLHLYVYGRYGFRVAPGFSTAPPSLVEDRERTRVHYSHSCASRLPNSALNIKNK